MGEKILEGTWEEIARLGPELAGRRVRVTILEEPTPVPLDLALAPLIASAERLARPDAPEPAADWGEGVEEKFRRQGFDL
jgi:hypothetical protein